jgi:branched-subunit amino acid aminotransferase/4-amino-4-deoxychorismate lyase
MLEFRLIETMRVSESGDVFLLERHLDRLSRSAKFFSFPCDRGQVREAILQVASRHRTPAFMRLTLGSGGDMDFELGHLPNGNATNLKLSTVRVNSNDVFLYHKTTRRGLHDAARRECDEQTDAILVNERGEITETTITNIAVSRGGQWITPAVSCGLLSGVMREELLPRGEIVEGVILASELRPNETIRCFNALRGVFEARFV